jgi:hypothetical protein
MKPLLILVGATLLGANLLASAAHAKPAKLKPLSEADVLRLVELAIDDAAVVARLHKGGVDFKVDDAVIGRLKKAGASEKVLAALQKPGAPPITPANGVIASGQHDSGAVLELTEIKRTSDDFLMVNFRYRNPTDKPLKAYHGHFVVLGDTDVTRDVFAEIYYVEPSQKVKKVKHGVVSDDSGKLVSSVVRARDLLAPAKDTGRNFWVKMSKPDDDADKATFYFLAVAPIEDVPLPPVKK